MEGRDEIQALEGAVQNEVSVAIRCRYFVRSVNRSGTILGDWGLRPSCFGSSIWVISGGLFFSNPIGFGFGSTYSHT